MSHQYTTVLVTLVISCAGLSSKPNSCKTQIMQNNVYQNSKILVEIALWKFMLIKQCF